MLLTLDLSLVYNLWCFFASQMAVLGAGAFLGINSVSSSCLLGVGSSTSVDISGHDEDWNF